jgi:hypothetical protein
MTMAENHMITVENPHGIIKSVKVVEASNRSITLIVSISTDVEEFYIEGFKGNQILFSDWDTSLKLDSISDWTWVAIHEKIDNNFYLTIINKGSVAEWKDSYVKHESS